MLKPTNTVITRATRCIINYNTKSLFSTTKFPRNQSFEAKQSKFKRRIESEASHINNPRNRAIQYFSHILCFTVGTYMVLYHDYGYEDHCFTPLRNWFHRKKNSFWTLSAQERKELEEQGKL